MSDKWYGLFMTLGMLLVILGLMAYIAGYGALVAFWILLLGLIAILYPNKPKRKRYRL